MPQRLLIVEKDGAICELARKALIPAEWRVATEEEADRALFGISAVTPDLVVCAADLGEMTGAEFADAVRAIPAAKNVPVIVVGGGQSEVSGVFALAVEAGPREFENALYDALADVSVSDVEMAESVELGDLFEGDSEGAGESESEDGGGLEVLELGDVEGGMELLEAIELPEADPDFVADDDETEKIELTEALELPETADEDADEDVLAEEPAPETSEESAPEPIEEPIEESFEEPLIASEPPAPPAAEENPPEREFSTELLAELEILAGAEAEVSPEPEVELLPENEPEIETATEPVLEAGEEVTDEIPVEGALSIEEAESLEESAEAATAEVEGLALDEALWELEEETAGQNTEPQPPSVEAAMPVETEVEVTASEEKIPTEEAEEAVDSDVVCELTLNEDAREAVKTAVTKAVERALTQEAIASLINSTVEKIVWEVVPPLAERLILEAIEKLKEPPGES